MNSKKDLQDVMNDFDMSKNYIKIIRRRKRKNMFFYFKIATVPICILMVTGYLLLCQSNNRFDKNNTKLDNNQDNINKSEINLDIYSIVDKETSWAYDVSNTDTLSEKADIIVKVKVLNIGEGTYEYTPNFSTKNYLFHCLLNLLYSTAVTVIKNTA